MKYGYLAFSAAILFQPQYAKAERTCAQRVYDQVCDAGARALCNESRVFEIGNDDAIAEIKQSLYLGKEDIRRLVELLNDPVNFAVAFEHEIGDFLALSEKVDCRLNEVLQISD